MDLMETAVKMIFLSVNQTHASMEALVLKDQELKLAATVPGNLQEIDVKHHCCSAHHKLVRIEALVMIRVDL